ncbi:hypothetical protein NLU13_2711 [Sarocladium strictum]|uniref:Uncharacterized protein n=1 Tax=Sarocladium strictum TaxID=5046 RepID=A0AA39GL00_SARSR|nr:hypothetical protein NLU13_2711 [Sarocladium strictum]
MGICENSKFTDRDAIHPDDHGRYNEYLSGLRGDNFIHMYPKDGKVIIDIYQGPPDRLEKRAEFKPSDQADEFFEEEKRQVEELRKAGLMRTSTPPIPDP